MKHKPYKPVTIDQVEALRKMANEKGVGWDLFEQGFNDRSHDQHLDSLKSADLIEYVPISDVRIKELKALAEEVGAQIHVVRHVLVDQNRDLDEAMNFAGTPTPSCVPEASSKYPSIACKKVYMDIVLLNYPQGNGDLQKATAWSKKAKLKKTNPREVFAIGEKEHDLQSTLGLGAMSVVATMECSLNAVGYAYYVWWGGDSLRRVFFGWGTDFQTAGIWFAFSQSGFSMFDTLNLT